MPSLQPNTQVLTGVGPGFLVPCYLFNNLGLPPGILCILSPNAVLTYSVEITGDDPTAPGYKQSTGNWIPDPNWTGLSASQGGGLSALVMGVRPHITAWTSGFLTFQFTQLAL